MRIRPVIAQDRHFETLYNCGGCYECPKDAQGRRLGPLVGYAGKYDGPDGKKLQWVGDVYANFAKAEPYPNVLKFFAICLATELDAKVGLQKIDVFCGAPIGGYSLADALGLMNDMEVIKAEKKVVAVATSTSREKSELVFARHNIKRGAHYVIVEDVCNNFSTTAELIKLIAEAGGEPVGIACFLNRSPQFGTVFHTLPIMSVVRRVINEWRQDDPAVATDVVTGNVVWKPKDEWDRLMEAMELAKGK